MTASPPCRDSRLVVLIAPSHKTDETMDNLLVSSTASAPRIGRHKQTNSLVGFDPLLADVFAEAAEKGPKKTVTISHTLLHTDLDARDGSSHGTTEVSEELRAIAAELGKDSPHQTKKVTKRFNKGNSLSPVAGRRKTSMVPAPISPSHLTLPWQKKKGHRKAKTLASAAAVWQEVYADQKKEDKSGSPLIQDLMELQIGSGSKSVFEDLSLPSLATQRPTSFLTGNDVVRSSEAAASEWQLGIPEKTEFAIATLFSQFLETYRREEYVLDLNLLVGRSRLDLESFAKGSDSPLNGAVHDSYRPQVEALLECCSDFVQVHGLIKTGSDSSDAREILLIERQSRFMCICRGTDAEQHGRFSKQSELAPLDEPHEVKVYSDHLEAFKSARADLFSRLDKMIESNPFGDLVFVGHSFGSAMSILSSFHFAWVHPELRIGCFMTGAVRVGLADFRSAVHSLPNLKVFRLDLARTAVPHHVGHGIRLQKGTVKAHKFDDGHETNQVRALLMKRSRDISEYVEALEALNETWVTSYVENSGAAVRGKNSEARTVT